MQEVTKGMGSISIEECQVDSAATLPIKKPRHYRLLILDLNGILISRRYEKDRDVKPPKGAYRQGSFFVWLRPGLDSFIKYIFENFDVAVWSSVMKHNIEPLAKEVFGKHYDELFFVADQDYCQKLDNPEIDPKTGKPSAKPIFRKNLDVVWLFPGVKGIYDVKNTLIVDDSDDKMINNPKECHFNPGTWVPLEKEDLSMEEFENERALLFGGRIRNRLEEYVAATTSHCQKLQAANA